MITKMGWFMFVCMWGMFVYGIFTQEWVRVGMAGVCLPLSIVLLWNGAKEGD